MPQTRSAVSHATSRALVALAAAIALVLTLPAVAGASRTQWTMVEDHPYLVRSGTAARDATLAEIKALGADALRIEVKWNEVAPDPGANTQPSFDATDPGAYPGF